MTEHNLSESYRSEISNAYDVFDEERVGYISINSLKILIRAFGFRVTFNDVVKQVNLAKKRRKDSGVTSSRSEISHLVRKRKVLRLTNFDSEIDAENGIDLDMTYDIMAHAYNHRDLKSEMKRVFELFDVDNSGYISFDNLKQVVSDLKNRKLEGIPAELAAFENLGDDQLKAMIDEFDSDLDGRIDENDFIKIMDYSI